MTLAEVASFIAVVLAAYATYRNTTRTAEIARLQERIADLEKRLADAEQRANSNEQKAIDYRQDVIKLGEQLEAERHESLRRISLVAADGNAKIAKVVIVLERVVIDFEAATGSKPDIDLEALKRLTVIENVTDRLGPIDVHAVRRYEQRDHA
jgi:uncharacterized protein YigA (DUF484 family)